MTTSRPSGMSVPDRGEKDGENAIDDDDGEDRLDNGGRRLAAERFGRTLDLHAFDAGDQPDHQRHDRRLDDADEEGVERNGVAQALQEGLRSDAAVEPGDEAATEDSGHRGDE